MKTRNSTKSKLLSSVIALVLCVSMLIGATFAWFTDTASTGVNKIQAGNLDVQLLDENDNSLEGKTLKWQKAAGHTEETVLWEPGCSYTLTPFKIKNNGNLALKYIVTITGIVGNAELLNVIDFTVEGVAGAETAAALNNFEGSLAPNSETGMITIKGTMKTTADNTYQGKSIDSIGITVRATQLGGTYSDVNGEFDSIGNEYDKDATYPPLATYINNTTSKPVTPTTDGKISGETVIQDTTATSTVPADTKMFSAYTNETENTPVAMENSGSLERGIKTTAATADSVTYDISYNYVNANGASTPVVKFGNVVENIIKLSAGLKEVKVTHTHGSSTTEMNPAANKTAKADGTFYYDRDNGELYIWSSKYSSFKIEYESNFEAAVGGQGYDTLEKAIAVAHAASEDVTVTLLKNVTLTADLQLGTGQRGVNLDLNGKTIDGGTYQVYTAGNGTTTIFGGGTIKNNNTEKNSNCAALYIPTGSSAVMDGMTLSGYYGVYANGTLSVKNAVINAVDCGIAANDSAKVTVGVESGTSNVTVTANAGNCISTQAAAGATGMNVTVYNGSFTSNGTDWKMCPIYWASHGTLNVYGGTFRNVTSSTGAAGLLQKNGTVNVYGGEFGAKDGIKLVAQGDSTEIVTNIAGGAFTGARSGIYIDASNGTYMGQLTQYGVTIANGNTVPTFIGGTERAIYPKTAGLGDKKLMVVSGGMFNEDPSAYLAEGKMARVTSDMYEVINDPRVKTEEQLKAAVEVGGEVTLGEDITLTSSLCISKDVTLNLGNFKLINNAGGYAVVLKSDSGVTKVTVNATTGGVVGNRYNCFTMPRYNDGAAELVINGGTYSSDSYFAEIVNGCNNVLAINSGSYSGKNMINISGANAAVTMSDGSFTCTQYGVVFGIRSNNSKFTMTGGKIINQNDAVITMDATGNEVNISGTAALTGKLSLSKGIMNVTGGTINVVGNKSDNRACKLTNEATLKISGNAKYESEPLFCVYSGTVNIQGGSFTGNVVKGLNYGDNDKKSVEDLLTSDYQLCGPDSNGWYQVVPTA